MRVFENASMIYEGIYGKVNSTCVYLSDILKSLSLPPHEWQAGKSKVFIRQKVYEPLEDRRQTTIIAAAIKIQALYRMHRHRKGMSTPLCSIKCSSIPT